MEEKRMLQIHWSDSPLALMQLLTDLQTRTFLIWTYQCTLYKNIDILNT